MRPIHEWNYSISSMRWQRLRQWIPLAMATAAALFVSVLLVVGAWRGRNQQDVTRQLHTLTDGAGMLMLDDERGVWWLGEWAEMLVDSQGTWSIDDVERSDGWQPVGRPRRSVALRPGVMWLRVTMMDARPPEDTGRDPRWRVEFGHPRPITLTTWERVGEQRIERPSGLVIPLAQREVVSRSVAVPLTLPPGTPRTIYFRLDTAPLGFSAVVTSELSSADRILREERWLMLYYGGAIFLLAYNLFLMVSLRDATYAWYAVVLVSTAHFFLARNGFYWLVGWNAASGWGGGAISALQLVGILQFTRLLLRTADESPRADRVLAVLVTVAVALGGVSLVFPETLNEAFIAPFGLMMIITAFVVGVQRARRGSTAARYFVAAWVAPAFGATLYTLKHTSLVPHDAFTEHSLQVGSALEMLLFSLALADRVRTLDRAIRERELRLAIAHVEHARSLDVMRADAASRMVEVQEEHSRRLARDLHDTVGHRFLLIEYAAATPDEVEARAAIVALAREGAAETREIAHGLYPQRLLDLGLAEALRSAADVVTRAGLQRVLDIDDNAVARLGSAERLAVLRVAEEALHNALRHGHPTTVSIRVATSGDAVGLEIADDGVGIADGAAEGLGLRTMRERAFLIGATLVVSPYAPRGTVVRLVIPSTPARRA